MVAVPWEAERPVLETMKVYWPDDEVYDAERKILRACVESKETFVTAGNKLGKDWIAGRIAPTFFLHPEIFFDYEYNESVRRLAPPDTPYHLWATRRVLTTSVKEKHLDVLWGEIGRALATAKRPLLAKDGGPLVINTKEIRFAAEQWAKNPINYLIGVVSQKGEGLAGHHAAYTLCIIDEASGCEDQVYEYQQGWAQKLLVIGNPHYTRNFYYRSVKAGDLLAGVA